MFCSHCGNCQRLRKKDLWHPRLQNVGQYNTFTLIPNSLTISRYTFLAQGHVWPERAWPPSGPRLISCNWKLSSRLRETLCFGINSLPVQTKHLVTNSALLATSSAAKKKVQKLNVFRCFFWPLELDVVIKGPQWFAKYWKHQISWVKPCVVSRRSRKLNVFFIVLGSRLASKSCLLIPLAVAGQLFFSSDFRVPIKTFIWKNLSCLESLQMMNEPTGCQKPHNLISPRRLCG